MIDFEKFVNHVPHPIRHDFVEIVTVKSSKGEERKVVFFDEKGFNEARKAHSDEDNRLQKLFFSELKEDLGIENNPKADLLIAKAMSHADGDFRGIVDWCEEMVDLIL